MFWLIGFVGMYCIAILLARAAIDAFRTLLDRKQPSEERLSGLFLGTIFGFLAAAGFIYPFTEL